MKTTKLSLYREDPDNVSTATDDEIARLAGKLRRNPRGLAAMRIAYVTDDPPGARTVNTGNKRLRVLKQIAADGGLCMDGAWLVSPAGDVPAEWFCDITFMTPEQRKEFRLNTNISDGSFDAEKLLAQYTRDDLAALMSAEALDELLGKIDTGDDGATDDESAECDDDPDADNPEYQAFVEKFKPKKTTDDCYTPEIIYNAVRDWAVKEYHLEGREIVRPFYPGGDYQHFKYPPRCAVVDNPPFSIMAEIVKWYTEKRIDFFLFAPALTLFSGAANLPRVGYVVTSSDVTYENGANVRTSFVTSLSPYVVDVRPDLHKVVEDANTENLRATKRQLPKLQYPMAVATAARLGYLSNHGIRFSFSKTDAAFIRRLDAQKEGDAIFGGAFLLCERAAAERAAAERAAALTFELSPRELEIQKTLGAANAPRQQNNSAHTPSDRLRGSLRSGDTPASLRLCVKNKTTTK